MPPTQKALLLPKRFGDLVIGDDFGFCVNPVDWKVHKQGIFVDTFPAILGGDIAGDVDELGPGVKDFKVGDRVVTQGIRSPSNNKAGFQQYTLASQTFLSKIPISLSYDGASSFPVALSAAYVGLYNKNPQGLGFAPPISSAPKENMQALPSSFSSFNSQNIRISPIITTASLKHAEYLQSLGATAILDRNLPSSALPVRAVYDAISSDETQQAGLDILAPKASSPSSARRNPSRRMAKYLFVTGGIGVPNNVELLSKFYHDIFMGLAGIPNGLVRLEADQVSNLKLVAHPQETSLN
ncbi:chaperonin 10-like protein [Pholiota molesta]|nr:chaperonin 10-like protein [Pholiota molesta]